MEKIDFKDLEFKEKKDKLIGDLPLLIYAIVFLFTIFFELFNAKFDLKVIMTAGFWGNLAIKYVSVMLTMSLLYPFFTGKLKSTDESKKISDNALSVSTEISSKKLSNAFKTYTKEKMDEEEKAFFKEICIQCGDLDEKYLSREFTLLEIKNEYKDGKLNKWQYLLLKKIKTGKICFEKLTGDEIKYITSSTTSKNKMYSYRESEIVKNKMIMNVISIFLVTIVLEIVTKSLFDQMINFKDNWQGALMAIFTTISNYATATWFTFKVSRKGVEEWQRFTQVITIFANQFLEDIENLKYKSSDSNNIDFENPLKIMPVNFDNSKK